MIEIAELTQKAKRKDYKFYSSRNSQNMSDFKMKKKLNINTYI